MGEPVKLNEVEELWVTSNYSMRPPTSADLLAAVRRGVESGTIKGEVVDLRFTDDAARLERWAFARRDQILVIPVSDGGSEPKLRCPKCGAHNAYGGDAETYPCSRCGFDGRPGKG